MRFKIATPERIVLETEVDKLTLPTTTGEITILPHHIALVSELEAGEIRYTAGNRENFFAVSGGIIEVKQSGDVIVLADTAEFGHEIDLERAEVARAEALQLMSSPHKNEKSFADAVTWHDRNLARIKVAKKHHTHKHHTSLK